MISQIVKDVLEEPKLAPLVADWLEDNCQGPELATYVWKFRHPDKLTISDAIEVIAKFGNPLERSQIRRYVRLLKRRQKTPEKVFQLAKDLTFKGRSANNKLMPKARSTKEVPRRCLFESYKYLVLTSLKLKSSWGNTLILDLCEMLAG